MGNAQVAYNRGKSVDTLSLFPVQYVSVFFFFFFRWKVQSHCLFWSRIRKNLIRYLSAAFKVASFELFYVTMVAKSHVKVISGERSYILPGVKCLIQQRKLYAAAPVYVGTLS